MKTHIDLFSGIGGFSLAAESLGLTTVLFVEKEPFCREVLAHHWPGVAQVEDVNDVEAITKALEQPAGARRRETGCQEVAQGRDRARGGEPERRSGRSRGALADAEGGQCEQHKTERKRGQDIERGSTKARTLADAEHAGSPCTGSGTQYSGTIIKSGDHRAKEIYLLTAGVPCQPASAAGKRLGSADDRWLWPQTLAVVERLKPKWCVFENPAGILSLAQSAGIPGVDSEADFPGRALCEICTALVRAGYDFARDSDGNPCFPVVPAAAVGAPHRRDRVWIVARYAGHGKQQGLEGHAGHGDGRGEPGREREETGRSACETGGSVGDSKERAKRAGLRTGEEPQGEPRERSGRHGDSSRQTLPDWSAGVLQRGADGTTRVVPRKPLARVHDMADGLSAELDGDTIPLLETGVKNRVKRLRALGNAIVPAVAQAVIASILETDNQ